MERRSAKASKTGTIVGAVVGTVSGVFVLGIVLIWRFRSRRSSQRQTRRQPGTADLDEIEKDNNLRRSESKHEASLISPHLAHLEQTAPTASATTSTASNAPSAPASPTPPPDTSLPPSEEPPRYSLSEGTHASSEQAGPSCPPVAFRSPQNRLSQRYSGTFSGGNDYLSPSPPDSRRLSAQTFQSSNDGCSILPPNDDSDLFHDDDDESDDEPNPFQAGHFRGPPVMDEIAIPTLARLAPLSPSAQLFHAMSQESSPTSPIDPGSKKWKRLSVRSITSMKSARTTE